MIYTAVYGGSDVLKPLPPGQAGRCFTDDAELIAPPGWEIVHEPLVHLGVPRLQAKWWKLRPDLAVPEADWTLWCDASMELTAHAVPEMIDELKDYDAAFLRHPLRDCIFEEVGASRGGRGHIYEGQPLERQVEGYRVWGAEPHGGLFASGLMLRTENERVREFGRVWWDENCRWSIQDQLSMTIAACELNWTYLSRGLFDQHWLVIHPHERDNP
jgi:hypothetical protein